MHSRPLASMLTLAIVVSMPGCDRMRAPAAAPVAAPTGNARVARADAGADAIDAAVRAHAQGADVQGEGIVERVLRDDTDGSAHQKFVLRLSDGTTVLVAHNVDIAPRLQGLAAGDRVGFRGEYLWNPKGGTLHWTHRDPRARHADGWLRWRGRTYD